MTYITGFITPVPEANKAVYIQSAAESWPLFRDYGALAHWETWEDDVPDGKVTSFPMAVQREPGEKVVFSWLVWPDKASSDACFATMDSDPRWQEMKMPFDGKRMVFGSFQTIFCETA